MRHIFVTAALNAAVLLGAAPLFAQSEVSTTTFQLRPNPSFLACISDGSGIAPTVTATVTRALQNDVLTLTAHHFKPLLAFDMFTVQNSNLRSDGTPDPAFSNFGMAWYQSDVQVGPKGNASTTIQTILLDQIFGFDPAVSLPPTNTFHVGIWFNNPNDAKACGFTGFTPFNGEHKAGPVAFITVPNAQTNLGPLCTSPNWGTNPVSCNP